MAGKQQAIVANIAGTTRDIIRVALRFGGRDIELLDTAPNKQLPERFIKRELFREANIEVLTKIITHLLAIRRISRVSDCLRPGAQQEAFIKLLPQ